MWTVQDIIGLDGPHSPLGLGQEASTTTSIWFGVYGSRRVGTPLGWRHRKPCDALRTGSPHRALAPGPIEVRQDC
jgi:hypothetical protein